MVRYFIEMLGTSNQNKYKYAECILVVVYCVVAVHQVTGIINGNQVKSEVKMINE